MSNTSEALVCPLLQEMMKRNHTEEQTLLVCFHGLVSCLGIMENALILWVVGFRLQRRTVTSVWVLNLAMSDFLTTLTLPLFTVYLNAKHSWELGRVLCKAQASIFFLNMFVSAFLLAAISLDRCLLVAKPVWSQNHRSVAGAWKVCALGWLWAVINTLPYFVFRTVNGKQGQRKLCYHHFAMYSSSQATMERDCEVRQAATAISKLLLAFLFPVVVIAGSYIHIAVSLRNRSRRRKQSLKPLASSQSVFKSTPSLSATTSSQTNQSLLSQSFTKMVTFVIAAFALCWAPYHIFCVLEAVAHYKRGLFNKVEAGLPLATTFAFLNSVLNPILYVFSCPNFSVRIRQSLGAVFDGLVEERGLLVLNLSRYLTAAWVPLAMTWRSVRPSKDIPPQIITDPPPNRQDDVTGSKMSTMASPDSFMPVTCAQCEPALIWEENRVPMAEMPVLVFSLECQLSCMVLDCEHRSH
ncbi:prostaglandin D2 receptor 2-like [Pagrus major]|uniref:prostaglandin D2 receptor 2-like n=1 Tax=Pagrus major TaxID=143350 RepID=UPI003CC85F78